jgi:Zn-dependent oligopeptidase
LNVLLSVLRSFQQAVLAEAEATYDAVLEPLSFYQHVSPSSDVRDASREVEGLSQDYAVDSSMRPDVFTAKVNAEKRLKETGEWEQLSSEEQRLVEKMVLCLAVPCYCSHDALLQILDGKRAGLALSEEKQAELASLQKELNKNCQEFHVSTCVT